MEIENLTKYKMTELLEMIWKINFWNMKKIGKLLETRPLYLITTFRAFATGVRELKKQAENF